MRYRLGEFVPQPGSSMYAKYLVTARTAEPFRQALEAMLQVRLSKLPVEASASPPTPVEDWSKHVAQADLLGVLDGSDAPWVNVLHGRIRHWHKRLPVRLLACEYEPGPDGFLTIAATTPHLCGEVRAGDLVQAGFAALRDESGKLRVWPRMFRLVCDNGSIVCTREGEEILAGKNDVAAAINRCFDRRRFASAVQTLRKAAQQGLPDPRPMLDEMGYLADRLGPHEAVGLLFGVVQERFEREKDPTAYGLVNAMTSVARDLPDARQRLHLEELAGRVAWLVAPTPVREGRLEQLIPV